MKSILLATLFFTGIGSVQAQFLELGVHKKSGNALLVYKDGTMVNGIVKNNEPLFGEREEDPLYFKFKEASSDDFTKVSSADVKYITLSDRKSNEKTSTYYPLRIRHVKNKSVFIDTYHTEFHPLQQIGDIKVNKVMHFYDNQLIGNDNYIQVGGEEYFFMISALDRRGIKGTAEQMLPLGINCPEYQEYVKNTFLEGEGGKDILTADWKALKKNKSEFINKAMENGYSKKVAKFMLLSERYFSIQKHFIDKYNEFCGSQKD